MGFFNDVFEDIKDSVVDTFEDLVHGDISGFLENGLKLTTSIITMGSFNTAKVGLEHLLDINLPDAPEANYKDRLVSSAGGGNPRDVVYGTVRKGGQVVYLESTGTDSKHLHLIIVWASHKCQSVVKEVYFNDALVIKDSIIEPAYSNALIYGYELGDQTTINPVLLAQMNDPEVAPALSWTEAHMLSGQCYSYFRLEYNTELYPQGIPNVSCIVEGKNDIYDPRNGGHYFTDNHALCVYDYLTWDRGFNIDSSKLDSASFITGANLSDQFVPSGVGQVEKRYTMNGTLLLNARPIANIESMLKAGAASCFKTQDAWYFNAGHYVAPLSENSFTEGDLVGGLDFSPGAGKGKRVNTVKGTFISPEQSYAPVDFVPVELSTYLAEDMEQFVLDLELPFTNSGAMARRLGKIALERSRYGLNIIFTLKFKALNLTAGDRITFTSNNLGWTKIFRIENIGIDVSRGITISAQEDASAIYSWNEGNALLPIIPPRLNLPDSFSVTNPENLAITQDEYLTNVLSRIRTKLTLTFDTGSLSANTYDIQFSENNGPWFYIGTSWPDTSITKDNLGTGTHRFRVKAINGIGIRAENWIEASINVINLTDSELDTAAPLFPITNLKLSNITGNEFTGKDAAFEWDNDNANLDYFILYQIEVINTSNAVVRTLTSTDPFFTYTYEMNVEDSAGRSFTLRVRPVSNNLNNGGVNYKGVAVIFAVTNPAPSLPTGLNVQSGFKVISFEFIQPTDLDYKEMRIWMGSTTGFTRNASTLVAVSNSSPIVVSNLEDSETYFVRLATYDAFGEGSVSSESQLTTFAFPSIDGGPWSSITLADKSFINSYIANDAIESTKIEKLTASKLVAGTIAVTEGISVDGYIEAFTGPFNVTLGPKDIGAGAGALLSFMNGSSPIFALFEDGSALFTGDVIVGPGSNVAAGADVTNYGDSRIDNDAVTAAGIGAETPTSAQAKANAAEANAIATAAADATAKANAANTAAQAASATYTSAQRSLAEITAAAYADGIVTAEENRAIADATAKANTAQTNAINTAAIDATAKANVAQATAIASASADATAKRVIAEAYADGIVTAEENRAIADATSKANAAQAAAISAASADATAKSNATGAAAQAAAISAAAADAEAKRVIAQAYADGIVDDEEQRAILDATTKANTARTNAEATAAADATTKASAAQAAAISAAYSDATDKANNATPYTLLNVANLTIVGSKLSKLTGGSAWDASAYSKEKYYAGAYVSARPVQTNDAIMFGLSDTGGATTTYTDIDYAVYLTSSGAINLYTNGSNQGNIGSYVAGDVISISYDNVKVVVRKNGVLQETLVVTGGQTLGFDCSFSGVGGILESLQFGPFAATDYDSISGGPPEDATNGATWDLNLTPPVRFSENASTGLNLTQTHMGYWNSSDGWKTYMQNNGDFFLAGNASNYLTWDASANTLIVRGDVRASSIEVGALIGQTIDGVTITGTTITGGTIRTAITGNRVELSAARSGLVAYGYEGATQVEVASVGNVTSGRPIFYGRALEDEIAMELRSNSDNNNIPTMFVENGGNRAITAQTLSGYGECIRASAINGGTGIYANGDVGVVGSGQDIGARGYSYRGTGIKGESIIGMPFSLSSNGGYGNFRGVQPCLIRKTNVALVGSQSGMKGRAVRIINTLGTSGDSYLFEVELNQVDGGAGGIGFQSLGVIQLVTNYLDGMQWGIFDGISGAPQTTSTYDLCLVYTAGLVPARVNATAGNTIGYPVLVDGGTNGELRSTGSSNNLNSIGTSLTAPSGTANSGILIPVMLNKG
jgi:hypothetical protein